MRNGLHFTQEPFSCSRRCKISIEIWVAVEALGNQRPYRDPIIIEMLGQPSATHPDRSFGNMRVRIAARWSPAMLR
jgi:hypothetical protein